MDRNVIRSLTFFDGVCLVVGLVLGVGIYQTPPIVAASVGSEFELYLVWVIGALLTLAGAMCYIELSTTHPEEGGDYYFLKLAFGPWAGFLFGWSQIFLIRPGAIAAMAFPFASYLKAAVPGQLGVIDDILLASSIVLILSLFNIFGTLLGVIIQNILSILAYVVLLGIAIGGALHGDQTHQMFSVVNRDSVDYGLALILVLFTYGGWSELALVAGEVKQPKINLFRSLIVGIMLITAIYCLVNYAFCNTIGFEQLKNTVAPAAHVLPSLGTQAISALVALCCLSSLNALILASARISFAFGRDFSWFSLLGKWNPKRNSPVIGLMVQCVISVLMVLLAGSFKAVLVYTTAVVWLFYFGVGASLIRLRLKFPNEERTHPTWGYPFTPLVFCLSCLYLIQSAFRYDLKGSAITLGFVAAGLIVFFLHQRFQSHSPIS